MKNICRQFTCAIILACLGHLALAQGTFEKISVHGASLEGNLAGDSPDREVFVYLPPGYGNTDRDYPVIYFLHGYAVGAQSYVERVLNLPDSVDAAMAAGAEEFIVVMPDTFNRFGGSMYSSSPTIGDWESFIAKDLVDYMDSHYRTLATPGSRGLSGHSMGGYGTLRIGMKYPDVFGALYAMSSCCLDSGAPGQERALAEYARMDEGFETQQGTMSLAGLAQAAAWSSNPQNPPYYVDLPFDRNGNALPEVQARWPANSPVAFAGQYVPALASYRAIFMDIGDQDGLITGNNKLDAALTRFGIDHEYVIYEGTHGNKIGQRFIDNVIPFFTQYLDRE